MIKSIKYKDVKVGLKCRVVKYDLEGHQAVDSWFEEYFLTEKDVKEMEILKESWPKRFLEERLQNYKK